MNLLTNLSIKTTLRTGEVVDVLPSGVELKYKLSYESDDLIRSASSGRVIQHTRIGKRKLTVEGAGIIPDLFREEYLNSDLEVIPGIRLYSRQDGPEEQVGSSVVKKENATSYRVKLNMRMSHFSCENNENDISNDTPSKWKLILEEL